MTSAAVGPLTTLTGWRAFVHRTITAPDLLPAARWSTLDAGATGRSRRDRVGTPPNCWRCKPRTCQVVSTGRSLLLLNHRQHGARRGLLVSGAPTTGKSTAITQLGRAVELAFRRTRPRPDDSTHLVCS